MGPTHLGLAGKIMPLLYISRCVLRPLENPSTCNPEEQQPQSDLNTRHTVLSLVGWRLGKYTGYFAVCANHIRRSTFAIVFAAWGTNGAIMGKYIYDLSSDSVISATPLRLSPHRVQLGLPAGSQAHVGEAQSVSGRRHQGAKGCDAPFKRCAR